MDNLNLFSAAVLGQKSKSMDGWTCPEGHLIDDDGYCPCMD
jgi:hypothetical protein